MTVALIYTRVSSDEQAQHGISLDAQLRECRQYVIRQGWPIHGEYRDVLSGQNDARPDYQRLLADCRELRAKGTDAAVVVAALDRFGRRVLERVRSREELKRLQIPTHSIREGGEVSDLVANIFASVAEEETRRLGERVRATRQHLRALGWKPPGPCPLGYRWRAPTDAERANGAPSSVLDVDPVTADTVRELFRRSAEGASLRQLSTWLVGLPPAELGGRRLNLRVISSRLGAPVYVARPDEGDADVLARPVGRWPALVDDLTWQRVRERFAAHQRFAHQISGRFLLIGYFRCPRCGNRVAGHATQRELRYSCQRSARGPVLCRWSLHVATLDRPVLAAVAETIEAVAASQPAAFAAVWDRLAKPSGDEDRRRRIAALRRQVVVAKDRLLKATQRYVDGVIDAASYELVRDDAQETIAGAESEIARLQAVDARPVLPDLRMVQTMMRSWAETFRTASVAGQREVFAPLVAGVDVDYTPPPAGRQKGRYAVAVRWTALGEALRACVR